MNAAAWSNSETVRPTRRARGSAADRTSIPARSAKVGLVIRDDETRSVARRGVGRPVHIHDTLGDQVLEKYAVIARRRRHPALDLGEAEGDRDRLISDRRQTANGEGQAGEERRG